MESPSAIVCFAGILIAVLPAYTANASESLLNAQPRCSGHVYLETLWRKQCPHEEALSTAALVASSGRVDLKRLEAASSAPAITP